MKFEEKLNLYWKQDKDNSEILSNIKSLQLAYIVSHIIRSNCAQKVYVIIGMKFCQCTWRYECGSKYFHFSIQSAINDQVVCHPYTMRLHTKKGRGEMIWKHDTEQSIVEILTNLHGMALSIMVISNFCVVEICYLLLHPWRGSNHIIDVHPSFSLETLRFMHTHHHQLLLFIIIQLDLDACDACKKIQT